MSKLKPCQFCGGPASLYRMPYIGGGGYGSVVECDRCWAKTGYYEIKDAAIAAWNRRTDA